MISGPGKVNSTEINQSDDSPSGFTLIELMVVIAIIAVLAGLTFAAIGSAITKAKNQRQTVQLKCLSAAMQTYRSEYRAWPYSSNDYSAGLKILIYSNGPNGNRIVIENMSAGSSANFRDIQFVNMNDYTLDTFDNVVDKDGQAYVFTFHLSNDSATVTAP